MAIIICSCIIYRSYLSVKNGQAIKNRSILCLTDSRSVFQTDDNRPRRKIIEGETWSKTFSRHIRIFSPNSNRWNDDRWSSVNMECHCRCWPNECIFICRCIVWFNKILIENFYWKDVSMLHNRLSISDKVCVGNC